MGRVASVDTPTWQFTSARKPKSAAFVNEKWVIFTTYEKWRNTSSSSLMRQDGKKISLRLSFVISAATVYIIIIVCYMAVCHDGIKTQKAYPSSYLLVRFFIVVFNIIIYVCYEA